MTKDPDKLTAMRDAKFDRLASLGEAEASLYVSWLAMNTGEKLSPFAQRALAHTFGHVIDRVPPENPPQAAKNKDHRE